MSGVAALRGNSSEQALEASVRSALALSPDRGEQVTVVAGPGCALGINAFAWELDGAIGSPPGMARSGAVTVVADASIYYVDDLLTRCGSETGGPRTPADLILLAYRRWGVDCPRYLEGDFAFILWDSEHQRFLAARDFAGTRPLFYAQPDGALAVASTIGSLVGAHDLGREYNLLALAEDAGGLSTPVRDETCYRAVSRLPAGWSLVADQPGGPRAGPHWDAPIFGSGSPGRTVEDAADELRDLLGAAVASRIQGVTEPAVWMSGGYDSTAVFGAGCAGGTRLNPVSMRYPADDPGYEDPWIESAAAHWQASVRWTDVADIAPLDRPAERAAARDEPFAHKFEMWNRALCRTTRAAGARLAVGGNGGDQLFHVSPVYLADLWRQVQWTGLAREWRSAFSGAGFRFFFRWAIQPNLSPLTLRLAGMARGGRPLVPYLQDRPPSWLRSDFMRRSGLEDRLARPIPRRTGEELASVETNWYFRSGFGARVNALVNSIGLSEGVALRSPLYDGRLVQFVSSLPRPCRTSGGHSKLVLRRAARAFLPADVVAPRTRRTGLPGGYLARSLPLAIAGMVEAAGACPLLADLGIVEPVDFASKCREYLADPDANGSLGPRAYDTLATELWLGSRSQ